MAKISVIIVTENCFEKIDTMMLSLFRQEEQDFEIICVDNHSTDRTLNLLQHYAEFDKRIRVITPEKKTTALQCCRFGLQYATAAHAIFLNGNHHLLLVQMFLKRLYDSALLYHSDVVYTPVIFLDALLFEAHQLYVVPKPIADTVMRMPYCTGKQLNPMVLYLLYFSPYVKLYRTEFIKNMDFDAYDESFFLNAMLRAAYVSFDLDFLCYRQIWPQDFDRPQIFDDYAQMKQVLQQNGVYNFHKTAYICRKMQSLWMAVTKALPEHQKIMFERLKKEFADEDFSQYDHKLLEQHLHYKTFQNLSTMSFEDFMSEATEEKDGQE